jgi:glycosyltransferase involved in cell wall biosynthesis
MMPWVYQIGRFLMAPCNGVNEAAVFFSQDAFDARLIHNLSVFLKKISLSYLLVVDAGKKISIKTSSLRCLWRAVEEKDAGMVYADYAVREGARRIPRPLIDYQIGSLRDDFRFGPLMLFKCFAIKYVLQKYGALPREAEAALYDLRLKISADFSIARVPEFLYVASEKQPAESKTTLARSEAHFAYVARENFLRQKQFEKIATRHLKRLGAYLPPRAKVLSKQSEDRLWRASIVIPVRNRRQTIAQALQSALGQKTDFPFNIIVVDNHSTDGTTGILRKFAARYPHVHHLIPSRRDLGIGGCWNEAIHSPYCGRYVVQLDSDDLYSSSYSLQKIIDTLRRGRYAMVVGSYTIVDERLKKIPPGLIDHREWTRKNGHNNLLRVNGMGAPRAFAASVLRQIEFPNVSYGEDYAVALRITREYKVGRIFENLYWCRRWKDNTDAGISVRRQNLNDAYKDRLRSEEIRARQDLNRKTKVLENQMFAAYPDKSGRTLLLLCQKLYRSQKRTWPDLAQACCGLDFLKTKILAGEAEIHLQYNPARAVSSGAAVDVQSVKSRPCFLCPENLPKRQRGILYRGRYLVLCNPAPIFKNHFTVASVNHEPQNIAACADVFLKLAADAAPRYAVFYNGPACGASAPDHLHFQMVPKHELPFLRDLRRFVPERIKSSVENKILGATGRAAVILRSPDASALREEFLSFMERIRVALKTEDEPMVNVICFFVHNQGTLIVFPRRRHRPAAYFRKGADRIFVSPGAVDMAGVVITPLLDNYRHLGYDDLQAIYREVSLPADMVRSIVEPKQEKENVFCGRSDCGQLNEFFRGR